MKQSEIQIGGTYYTNVGPNLVAVIVTERVEVPDFMIRGIVRRTSTKFRVKRADDGNILPKLRSASLLISSPSAHYQGRRYRR